MKQSRLLISVGVLTVLAVVVTVVLQSYPGLPQRISVDFPGGSTEQSYPPTPAPTQTPQPTTVRLTATEAGQTAFALLQANTQVAYKEYDFGVFVEGIDGVMADSDHFWALYVNDVFAEAGADATVLHQGDVTEWRYEAITGDEL